jgi:hypothetical protein
MDRDWMAAPVEAIMEARIAATYLGGTRVYDGSSGTAFERRLRARGSGCCGLG